VLVIKVLNNLKCHCFTMSDMQILDYPLHEVIFECPLYELVQKVRSKQFVNISMRKPMCKRLVDNISKGYEGTKLEGEPTTMSYLIPNSSQRIPGSNLLIRKSVFSWERR
jgi:hypothetical protein